MRNRCIIGMLIAKIAFSQTTGSITQGLGTTTTANLLPNCSGNHVTPIEAIQ